MAEKYTDAKFTLYGSDYYDLTIGEDGDIEKVNSFDTALLLSLFGSDRRASPTEVPESYRRRGWIGDIGKVVELGSKLWLTYQARLTVSTVNIVRDYTSQALAWLPELGYLKSVSVNCVRNIDRGEIVAEIELTRLDDSVESRNFVVWNNTGRAQ